MFHRRPPSVAAVLAAMCICGSLSAQHGASPIQVLSQPEPGSNTPRFGDSVDIDGDVIAVSARSQTTQYPGGNGVTYVFERVPLTDMWVHTEKIVPGGAGTSGVVRVRVWEDNIFLTRPQSPPGQGTVEIYTRQRFGDWAIQQVLSAPPVVSADYFGYEVDVSRGVAAISARADILGSNSGVVFMYARNNHGTWMFEQQLLASNGSANDVFGGCLALDGDTMVVSAPSWDLPGTSYGTGDGANGIAYIFRRDNDGVWYEEAIIEPHDRFPYQNFGSSVAIDGQQVAIGVPHDEQHVVQGGAVYIFERSGDGEWIQTAKLRAAVPRFLDRLGTSIALQDNMLIAGAPNDPSHNDPDVPGFSIVFEKNASGRWIENQRFGVSPTPGEDAFGSVVRLDGDLAIVADDYRHTERVYLYHRADLGLRCDSMLAPDCNHNGTHDVCDIESGSAADCNGNFRPDVCDAVVHDCNLNGVVDECEILLGAPDCDSNGLPDECDLDSNWNGVPDACEPLPINDTCENAVVMGTGIYAFSNVGASAERLGGDCGAFAADIWFQFTVDSGDVYLLAHQAPPSIHMALYSGCAGSPEELITCSSSVSVGSALIQATVDAGTYRVRIGTDGAVADGLLWLAHTAQSGSGG